jgi:hypothetical protein
MCVNKDDRIRLEKHDWILLIAIAVLAPAVVAGAVASFINRANNTSTSPDRVITCTILDEHMPQDESDSTHWTTDRCGVLFPPETLLLLFNSDFHHAVRVLDPGHTYRIRVHDVHFGGTTTHIVRVEGPAE